jgi:putative endonuclease
METGGHVYILGSTTGTLYIGMTSGLYTRVLQHRAGTRSGFAHQHGCNRLLYVEPCATMDETIAREKQLKGWTRAKKLALISNLNPEFKDMAKYWGWRIIPPDEPIKSPDTQTPKVLSLPPTNSSS